MEKTSKTKRAKTQLSFKSKISQPKKGKRTKQESAEQKRFNKHFVKKDYTYKELTWAKKDVAFFDFLLSEEVNDPMSNRKKSADNIYRYYRCLKSGNFHPQTTDIYIDWNGQLMNGQHTLEAIVQFFNQASTSDDTKIQLNFKVGCDPSIMPYLDSALPRTFEQNFSIKIDGKDSPCSSSIAQIVKLHTRHLVHKIDPLNFGGSKRINYYEAQDVLEDHGELLNELFNSDGTPSKQAFPIGVQYSLFRLALEDEAIAQEICGDIREVSIQNSSMPKKDRPKSKSMNNKDEEHELLEIIRQNKANAEMNDKKYGHPQQYNDTCDWITENYGEVDSKIFAF